MTTAQKFRGGNSETGVTTTAASSSRLPSFVFDRPCLEPDVRESDYELGVYARDADSCRSVYEDDR